MNKENFVRQALERFKEARTNLTDWRKEARDSYAFVAGRQWLPEDEALLEQQKRPPITFNYSEKMIDAVVGAEVSNRQEVRYSPRGVEDSGLSELWTAGAKWVRDECNAEDEESDAFRDMGICGLGWTFTHPSYETDLDGTIAIDRIDPLEMSYDTAATKVGLTDRRWDAREYWVDRKDVIRAWPNAPLIGLQESESSGGVVRHGQGYNDNDDDDERDRHKNQVKLCHYECYEYEHIYRVGLGQEIKELTEAQFRQAKPAILEAGAQFVRQRKRVYYHAFFIGETVLQIDKSPSQEGFLYNCITGKRDRNKNVWYGLTRVMKDPQRWANKWLSQILHIINSNAKGGLLAEINAFVDQKKAEEEWSSPDSITLLTEGALSMKKVQQKQPAPYPAGLDKLMEFALGSLPMVTGINLEAIGLANREQAGVLEVERKNAAYGMLSPLFDAIRRYRKVQGRVMLYLMNEYISDGRMVRIGGPEMEQFAQLTKVPGAMRYDIIVDQSPNAPDVKQQTWRTLENILPAMMKAGYPIPPDVLDYTPLPTTLSMKWKQHMGEKAQADQQLQQENAQLKEQLQQAQQGQQIKAAELQQKQQEKEMELAMRERELQFNMEMEQRKMQFEFQMKQQAAELEAQLEVFKLDKQMEIEERKAQHQMKLNEVKTAAQASAIEKGAATTSKE